MILDRMRGIFAQAPENDEELNQMIEVHVRENRPMIKKGLYSRERPDCEFSGAKMSYRDDYCELKIDGVLVNESVETT